MKNTPTPTRLSPVDYERQYMHDADAEGDGPALGDSPSLLRAVTTRLRLAAAAHGSVSACACPEQGQHPSAIELAQLRHIVLESARALEHLHSTLAEAGRCESRSLQRSLDRAHDERVQTRDSERRALSLALNGALTEPPNRHYPGRLHSAMLIPPAAAPALALLLIDLDDFKQVNDAHGHATGDELLHIVATRLRHAVRNEDMVCRLGGDEFVLLLHSPFSREQLEELARHLRATIAAPIELAGTCMVVHSSIGIAFCPLDGSTPQALMDRADKAMYRAKRSHIGFAFHEQQAFS